MLTAEVLGHAVVGGVGVDWLARVVQVLTFNLSSTIVCSVPCFSLMLACVVCFSLSYLLFVFFNDVAVKL